MHKSKGKLSGVLHKGFKPDKCKTALRMAVARIKLLRNRKEAQVRQMRREIAQLLDANQDQTARIRVEHVIREEKFMQAYDLIEVYCELIVARLSIIDSQKSCPIDLKEAIASVIFASMRCSDVTELADVRKHFTNKYGKEFAAAALEVRPDSGVNRLVIEKLSAGAPDVQTKTKTLSSIAEEHNIKWEPKAFEEKLQKQNEDLLYGSATYSGGNIPTTESSASSMSTPQPPVPSYTSVESATSHMPTAPSYSSAEVSASGTPYGFASSNAFSQENRGSSDASVPPSSQHGATTYSSAHIPGSNNFSHANTGGSSVSRPYSQYGATIPDTMSRSEEINQPREGKSSVSGSNWNVEFKDATSAAQAAADSAEMASIAARAAAQLASRGNFSAEQNTGAYESAAHSHETTPRKQQAEHLMKDDNRSFNEQSSGVNGPRVISSDARKDVERAETNRVDSQNMSSPYSAQFHSYGPESRSDVYGMTTEPPRAHSPEPPYFDDSLEKSYFGRPEDHPFDLPGEGLPDAGLGGRNIKDMKSRQASFDQENTNTYYSNFSSFHSGSSTIRDRQNNKTGGDSSAVVFDQYESDVEEENLLDPFSSKHTDEPPTVQDHKGFSSADWSQQHRSESPVNHSTSTLFSRTETQPPYNLEANRKDITSPHSYDNAPPTFDSDGVSSDEEITTAMHAESLRSHSRGSGFSENKEAKRISGKLAPDVNESIDDDESRSRKKYQNLPGFNSFDIEQHGDGSPRSDYSGALGNLGRVQSRDYDLSEEETELHKLKGASSEISGTNENQPLSFGKQTSATSDGNNEGDLGLNFGRLTPGLRNKLRQPPPYTKNSGDNMMPKQSLHKAAASNEESVHSKENDTSFEQIADTPKSSRTTKSSFGANYNSELYDRNRSVGARAEARLTMTRNYFEPGDTGKLSEQSGNAPSSLTNKISVGANSSQELNNENTGIGARRETRPRNARSYFDSDDSEEELEQRQTAQTKLSREQIQSRRTREVISDTRRYGRNRTGAQYADETETMTEETKAPAEAFSNTSTEQSREAPAYSRVPVQRPSPKPVRIEPPTARGKSHEAEVNRSSVPENEDSTETSAGTPKESTSKTAPAHVHPKLPTDYDSFAAHFMSLRTNRR